MRVTFSGLFIFLSELISRFFFPVNQPAAQVPMTNLLSQHLFSSSCRCSEFLINRQKRAVLEVSIFRFIQTFYKSHLYKFIIVVNNCYCMLNHLKTTLVRHTPINEQKQCRGSVSAVRLQQMILKILQFARYTTLFRPSRITNIHFALFICCK